MLEVVHARAHCKLHRGSVNFEGIYELDEVLVLTYPAIRRPPDRNEVKGLPAVLISGPAFWLLALFDDRNEARSRCIDQGGGHSEAPAHGTEDCGEDHCGMVLRGAKGLNVEEKELDA